MERESQVDRWSVAMIVAGGVLTAVSLRRPAAARAWAATLGVACAATAFFCHSGSRRAAETLGRLWCGGQPVNDAIDTASADSFPASDPPASIPAAATPK
jgi:hypothetical protein